MIIEVVSLDLEVRSRIIHLSSMLIFIHEFRENYSRLFRVCCLLYKVCVFFPKESRESKNDGCLSL